MEPDVLIHNEKRLHLRDVIIPDNYTDALQTEFKEYWLEAMRSHLTKLESNNT